VQHLTKI